MNRNMPILAGAVLAVSFPAHAETMSATLPLPAAPAPTPAQLPPIVYAPAMPVLFELPAIAAAQVPAPTQIAAQPVSLRTIGEVSSHTAKLGDVVSLEVAGDVLVDGKLVIPAGSRAFGEVTTVQRKRGWGKPGTIEARILYVLAGDQRVALDGTIAMTGESRKKKAIRTSLLIAPFCGFWIHGRDAVLAAATTTIAYLPGATALALASATKALQPVVLASVDKPIPSIAASHVPTLASESTFATPATFASPAAFDSPIAFISPAAVDLPLSAPGFSVGLPLR